MFSQKLDELQNTQDLMPFIKDLMTNNEMKQILQNQLKKKYKSLKTNQHPT